MGYLTFYNFSISGSAEATAAVKEAILKAADPFEHCDDPEEGFQAKWYDYNKDLANISKDHPGVLIEVSGDGENADDRWKARYRDGKSETVRMVMPPFTRILTDEEAKTACYAEWENHRVSAFRLLVVARKRIGTLLHDLCGADGATLNIEALNEQGPQLEVLTNAPGFAYGIKAIDGDGVLAEDNTSLEWDDIRPDSLFDAVKFLENLHRFKEAGTMTVDGDCRARFVL